METEDVKALIERIIKRAQEPYQEGEDAHLAAMAGSKGWEIFKGRMESIMLECLTPFAFQESTPLEVRGAINEARGLVLKEMKNLLSGVEMAQLSESNRQKKVTSQSEEVSE